MADNRSLSVAVWQPYPNQKQPYSPPFTPLNRQIAEAEKSHDDKTLASLLAPDLKFRRASAVVVGREDFLKQLAGITYEYNQPDDGIRVTCLDEHIFMVEVQVKAKGVGPKGSFEGHPKTFGSAFPAPTAPMPITISAGLPRNRSRKPG